MSTEKTLSGRVAIVTGGARGIGLAIVEELHRRGVSVLIADSGVSIAGADPDPSVAQSIAAKLGANAAAFGEDLSQAGAVEQMQMPGQGHGAVQDNAQRLT